MRLLCILLILTGMALGFGYPWYMYNMSGAEIGHFRVYQRGGQFKPVDVILSGSQAPVRVFVDMVPLQGYYPSQARTMLTLTASTGGRTVLAASLNFISSTEESKNLQNSDKVFRDTAGDIMTIAPGSYHFVVGEGDVEGLSLKTVNLVLRSNAKPADPRAMPAGIGMIALGIFGLAAASRRAGRLAAEEAAKPKWGRDAGGGS
jgi:hypothetical protein